jgi:hypothetical protein
MKTKKAKGKKKEVLYAERATVAASGWEGVDLKSEGKLVYGILVNQITHRPEASFWESLHDATEANPKGKPGMIVVLPGLLDSHVTLIKTYCQLHDIIVYSVGFYGGREYTCTNRIKSAEARLKREAGSVPERTVGAIHTGPLVRPGEPGDAKQQARERAGTLMDREETNTKIRRVTEREKACALKRRTSPCLSVSGPERNSRCKAFDHDFAKVGSPCSLGYETMNATARQYEWEWYSAEPCPRPMTWEAWDIVRVHDTRKTKM